MAWFFVFFFISGFCSVLYELIWLRLAMAQFGVTTALTSIVLSVFMAGLGVGSWSAGKFTRCYQEQVTFPPLRLYAVLELLIGVSAFAVPAQLVLGHRLLEHLASQSGLSSAADYLISGVWLATTMIPWCACMGATIPIAMFAIRRCLGHSSTRTFSFLYLANVLGAAMGSFLPLLLIELLGFHATLRTGAVLNAAIAACALILSFSRRAGSDTVREASSVSPPNERTGESILLFTTGVVTMGLEVVWIRLFTPYVGPVVYSFGMILVAYLLATFAGSQIYRYWSRRPRLENPLTWISLALLGMLPLLTADPRVPLHLVARVFVGVMPFAGMMGFLTPMLVDRCAAGDPDRAGRAYAVNIGGCIAGPLLSGFLLLPFLGEHIAMAAFSLPWFVFAYRNGRTPRLQPHGRALAYVLPVLGLAILFATQDYETQFPVRAVLRDATATVIARGTGMERRLLVNGMGMTKLTPITKMMAHMTLASLDHPPRRALIICFGMGTTFRSVMSWGIPATVVELVPSVPRFFSYYHSDGPQLMASPLAHVVIDDGRRFLERSTEKFDAIIIDPPPPVQTAGSSLLYSEDFYSVARRRLEPGGILQQWLPEGDDATQTAVARALKRSFPYVCVYRGIEGWGWHFLASERPIPSRTASEMAARVPANALRDMMEWGPGRTPEEQFQLIVSHSVSPDSLIALSPKTPALRDDRPINEYFLLRTPFHQLMAME